jgi:glutamate-ammonia-ligase adenylyltransferase
LKYVRGGLVDLEFICQFLQLIHAEKYPDILQTHTRMAYVRIAAAKLIPPATADSLIAALDLTHNLIQVVRICVEGVFKPEEATTGLKSLLARVGNAPDFAALEAQLRDAQAETRRIFDEILTAHAVAP